MSRRLGFVFTTDREFKAWIGLELLARIPALGDEPLPFIRSLEEFIADEAYAAFGVDWIEENGEQTRYSGGLVTRYFAPMSGYTVLCVESAWFADGDDEAHEFVWTHLAQEAQRLDALDEADGGLGCKGLAVRTDTVRPAAPLLEAVQAGALGEFGVLREPHLLLQHWIDGRWSAFTGETSKAAQLVNCVRIVPRVEVSIAGVQYEAPEPLYRGEGRVGTGPYLDCASHHEVIEKVFSEGFTPRVEGTFNGTLVCQIHQQGYVPHPTLSLTSSFEAAVLYATASGTREQREKGIVFTLDPDRLREFGPIWDSVASMVSGVSVFVHGELDSIAALVRASPDLRFAGRFLERLAGALRHRAREYDTHLTIQPPIRDHMSEDDWTFAQRAIGPDRFEGLCSLFEYLVPYEKGQRSDLLVTRGAYAMAFTAALPELERSLETSSGVHRHPGWDTTLFGYIAKTCRDREFLSSGAIPPQAVIDAAVVNGSGDIIDRYTAP